MNIDQHKDASFSRRYSERDEGIEFLGKPAKENDMLSGPRVFRAQPGFTGALKRIRPESWTKRQQR
jgi:hypothetical protein